MTARPRLLVAALLVLLPGVLVAQGKGSADLRRDLERLSRGEGISGVPSADSVAPGAATVAARTTWKGTLVARGPVDVYGRVEGSAVSLAGDVTVHAGGVVTGDALAVGGRVSADSGRVDGEMRSVSALPVLPAAAATTADVRSPAQRAADTAKLVTGSFAILLIVAIGVILFAGRNLDEVVVTLEQRFAGAFWYGVLGQIVVLPVLAVLVIALAVSLIGILLIPFAIVAYAIACAGLVTLGFLAVARLVGGGFWRGGQSADRVRTLGSLAAGIAIFFVLWMFAALFSWAPVASTVVRAGALAATWAAMTLGLGAAILSRAGTHRRMATAGRPAELAAWQTPTPVAGVVAARRTSTTATREGR